MNTIILSIILSIILILIFIMFGLGRKTQDVKLQETVNVSPPCKEMSLKAYKYEFKELVKKDYYVFVDVLTIDGNYTENQIIELAYIRINRKTGRITETYTTFVRPYRLERLHSVHGKLESAPLAKDVATKLETAFADAVVIGYNMFPTIGSIVAMGYIAGVPLDVRMFDVYEEMDRFEESISLTDKTIRNILSYHRGHMLGILLLEKVYTQSRILGNAIIKKDDCEKLYLLMELMKSGEKDKAPLSEAYKEWYGEDISKVIKC